MIEQSEKVLKDLKARGYNVYSTTQLVTMQGEDKQGIKQSVKVELAWSQIDPMTCMAIFQKAAPVFGVVTGRANKISCQDWNISPVRKDEDKIAFELKDAAQMFRENLVQGAYYFGVRLRQFQKIRQHLPDVLPDLSNFDASLRRWGRRIRDTRNQSIWEIEDWLRNPSQGVTWTDFCKQYVQDLLVHGRAAVYKRNGGDCRLANLYLLPGGTVLPIKSEYVGQVNGYIQTLNGIYGGVDVPQLFFRDEISFAHYMPNSATAYGMIPIDALINMITAFMLSDRLFADQSDGTQLPNKLLVFGDRNPGLDPTDANALNYDDPIDPDEQRRIEKKLNTPQKMGAVATITGTGQPFMFDISKENILQFLADQKDVTKKYVGIVFNASNLELNETGGDGTSGRSVSEAQERQDNAKGTRPITKMIEERATHDWIPFRFGYGWQLEFINQKSDQEQIDIAKAKKDSGLFSVNEIREKDFDAEPYPETEFDRPQGASPEQQAAETMKSIQAAIR